MTINRKAVQRHIREMEIAGVAPGPHLSRRDSEHRVYPYLLRDLISAYPNHVFVERLWRTVKYEEVYLRDYASPREARQGLSAYFLFYNEVRPHQALGYRPISRRCPAHGAP